MALDPQRSMASGRQRDSRLVAAYGLWIALGSLGAHRFYFGRMRSALAMCSVTIAQAVLIVISFSEPLRFRWVFCFWPPIAAGVCLKAVTQVGFGLGAPAGSDLEAATAAPLVLLATLPSLALAVWLMIDGFAMARWARTAP